MNVLSDHPVLYIVVPCYNEEEVLDYTNAALTRLLSELITKNVISDDSRILYVNDGSKDRTWQKIVPTLPEN